MTHYYYKVGAFTDINAVAWYAKGVKWALVKKIVSDESAKFSPDAKCTKADFYTFLWNAAGRPHSSGTNYNNVLSTCYISQVKTPCPSQ